MEMSRLRDIMYEVKVFPEEWVKGKIKVPGGRPELASPLNYARFYLPKLYPNLKKVVSIDDDAVVQGDVSELYETKLDPGHWAAFSEDCTGIVKKLPLIENRYFTFIDYKNEHVKRLDLNPTTCSFNIGVFVTDLNIWRKYNITEKLEYWLALNKKEDVYGNEQGGGGAGPPMMLVFSNNYTNIDPKWHVRYLGLKTGTNYSEETVHQAKLLHWNGPLKPWNSITRYSHIWDKYFIPDPTGKFKVVREKL